MQCIETDAAVTIEKASNGFHITKNRLSTKDRVPGIDTLRFKKLVEQAKAGYPVSQALAGPSITLDAELLS